MTSGLSCTLHDLLGHSIFAWGSGLITCLTPCPLLPPLPSPVPDSLTHSLRHNTIMLMTHVTRVHSQGGRCGRVTPPPPESKWKTTSLPSLLACLLARQCVSTLTCVCVLCLRCRVMDYGMDKESSRLCPANEADRQKNKWMAGQRS